MPCDFSEVKFQCRTCPNTLIFWGRSLEYLLRPTKGVQILLSPPKRGPKFVKDPQKRRRRTYTGDGAQAKGQPPATDRPTERRSDGLLACFLLLSWRSGNRIAACLLRFLTLRWCKPEVRKLCWITHISKLKIYFLKIWYFLACCFRFSVALSSFFFSFLLLSFSLPFFFLSLDLFN
jgi:hypothetical protein